MNNKKLILIIGEFYPPLLPWYLEDKKPMGVPAVFNLYEYLSRSNKYSFHSIIFTRSINKIKTFKNGSILELKKFYFPNYYLWKMLVSIKLFLLGSKILKANKFDYVYGLGTFTLVASFLGKKYKIPSVGRIFGTILTKSVINRNYLKLYTRFIFDILSIKYPTDIVLATQDGTEYDKVFSFFNKKKKIDLLYNGIERHLRNKLLSFAPIESLPASEPINLIYMARFEYYKRQELAISLMDNLVNKLNHQHIYLQLVGNGSRREKIELLIRQKGLESNITILEAQAQDQIPMLLHKAHAALFFYEGGSLGNILWESALGGRLIITVATGGTGNVIKDGINGLILPDSPTFAENMSINIQQYIGKDISHLTLEGRKTAERLIKPWEDRFDAEFEYIFNQTSA